RAGCRRAKAGRLGERLVEGGALEAGDLHVREAAAWDHVRLVHDPEYVAAVASGTLTPEAQRRIGFPWSRPWKADPPLRLRRERAAGDRGDVLRVVHEPHVVPRRRLPHVQVARLERSPLHQSLAQPPGFRPPTPGT